MSDDRPPAPENVRAVLPDGGEIPLSPRYVGVRDGIHTWVVDWPFPGVRVQLKVDRLPARSAVNVMLR
jgi:hypothetical protein